MPSKALERSNCYICAQDLVKQFSVFSNLFLLAQLNKVINAPTIEEMREGKEILANEVRI